ncbi:hypothetical protein BDA99DRAFT_538044 [Phascolomyces articulosus]|uniref:Uncharacterized protein n=1 Tax=Phascolomyces articulosus TaxID=60185 RepID=A0AAD5PDT4_9FUNG|nr:hypothetical protein BDA99DRAFT_538044 [Phascolomyces articulosus]
MTIKEKGGGGLKIYGDDGTRYFSIEIYYKRSTLRLTFYNLSNKPVTIGYQFLDEKNQPLKGIRLVQVHVPPHSFRRGTVGDGGHKEFLKKENLHGHGVVQGDLKAIVTGRRNGFITENLLRF